MDKSARFYERNKSSFGGREGPEGGCWQLNHSRNIIQIHPVKKKLPIGVVSTGHGRYQIIIEVKLMPSGCQLRYGGVAASCTWNHNPASSFCQSFVHGLNKKIHQFDIFFLDVSNCSFSIQCLKSRVWKVRSEMSKQRFIWSRCSVLSLSLWHSPINN